MGTPWDYVVPKRKDKVPPKFAKQSVIDGTAANEKKFEDTQPLFLRDKGDDLFKDEDFSNAIQSYTECLSIRQMSSVLLSRSFCYFRLKSFTKALKDMITAFPDLDKNQIFSFQMFILLRGILNFHLQ